MIYVSLLFGFAQVIPLMIISLVLAIPVGEYLALVFSGGRAPFDRFFHPIESAISRLLMGLDRDGMDWKEYVVALLITNVFLWLITFVALWVAGMSPALSHSTRPYPSSLIRTSNTTRGTPSARWRRWSS